MDKPKLTIATMFAERWYCLDAYFGGLMGIRDRQDIDYIAINSSTNELFHSVLEDRIKSCGFRSYKIVPSGVPIVFQNEHDVVNNTGVVARMTNVALTTNKAREEILKTDCDYGWIIEDDNVIPPDAKEKHLAMFDHKASKPVGASVCYAIQRYKAEMYGGRSPLAWDFIIKYTFGEQDTSGEKQVVPIVAQPPADVWVEEMGSATFGSILIKREVLEKIKFTREYKTLTNHDIVFGLQLLEAGYCLLIDWNLHVKHIHYTGEVLL